MSNNSGAPNKEVVWTADQLDAIQSRGANLLVSAGAGSGKTAVMIERIAGLLREGADLSKMLICTFTVTAAADMRRKLDERLNKGASGDANLAAAQKKLPLAEICTLDSWCSHVIKNRFFISDLNPDFTVLDDGEADALKAEICERIIEEQCSGGDTVFAELYEALLNGRSHNRLRDAVLQAYDYAVAQPYPSKWLERGAQRTDAEYRDTLALPLKKQIGALAATADKLLVALGAAGFAADYNALKQVIKCVRSYGECNVETPQLRGKPELKDLHEQYKELVAEYKKMYGKLQKIYSTEQMPPHAQSEKYSRKIAELAQILFEKYGQAKRERGKADYADLEHQTLKILNNEEYGAEIARNYTHVFVDEYQDISPLQEELLRKFDCEMFFVGDVKQSIYGFRMCRPDFFTAKRDSYSGGAGKTISLNTNFRSGGEIIQAVNSVFTKIMTRSFGGADYAQDKFGVGKAMPAAVKSFLLTPPPEQDSPSPKVYSVSGDAGEGDELTAREVYAVTEHIINLLDAHSRGEADEVISYEDIAVLVRGKSEFVDMLQNELRARGIPVTFSRSSAPADSFTVVSALISMLRVINNSRDDVSLATVLLCPMFGNFTPEELNELRRGDSRAFCDSVYGYNGNNGVIMRKLDSFLNKLSYFVNVAAASTVAELAGVITGECDCFNYAMCLGGEREAAALDAFCEYLAAADPNDLFGALRQIDRAGAPILKVGDGGKAVKIMTIHSSKGLEFKYVILPRLHRQFNFSDAIKTIVCDEQEGIVMRSYDLTERTVKHNPRFDAAVAKLKRNLVQEEMRMLYVAMTRAQNGLYLFSYPPKRERGEEEELSYIDWLYPYLFDGGKAHICEGGGSAATPPCERAPVPEIVEELKSNFAANARVAKTGEPVKLTVSAVAHDGQENPVMASWGEDAAARGTAYHKFMQYADFADMQSYGKLCLKYPREAAEIDREQITAAFKNVGEFIGGRRYAREKQFVYSAPDLKGGRVLIQGVIDLMVWDGDGVDIVDYKTGALNSVKSNPAYIKQLKLYAEAVRSILKLKVNKTYLYSFDGGCFIRID